MNAIVLREGTQGSSKALLRLLRGDVPEGGPKGLEAKITRLLVWGEPMGSATFEGALVSQSDTLKIEYYYPGKPVLNDKKIDHFMDRKEAIAAMLDDADIALVVAGDDPPKYFNEIINRMEKRKKKVLRCPR